MKRLLQFAVVLLLASLCHAQSLTDIKVVEYAQAGQDGFVEWPAFAMPMDNQSSLTIQVMNGSTVLGTFKNFMKIDFGAGCTVSGVTATCTGIGSPSFSAITSGTNTTAAMHVGAGATLDATNTGTITANLLAGTTIGVTNSSLVVEAASAVAASSNDGNVAAFRAGDGDGIGGGGNLSLTAGNAGTTGSGGTVLLGGGCAGACASGSATNRTGGAITIAAGRGTGTATESIIFQIPHTLTTGSTLQTQTTQLTINDVNILLPSGNVLQWNGDSGISRDSVGVFDFGNGTAADITGSIKAATATFSGVPLVGTTMPVTRTVCANVTPVTVNANVSTDQLLMACTIPATSLNVLLRTLEIDAYGIYTTAASSTSQLTYKIKICTVSGCGSGTVVTAISIQSVAIATLSITNNAAALHAHIITQTIGATASFEAHGRMDVDLGALTTAADSIFNDTNTATVGTIDATAQLFVQITGAFSGASASNSWSQRSMLVKISD